MDDESRSADQREVENRRCDQCPPETLYSDNKTLEVSRLITIASIS